MHATFHIFHVDTLYVGCCEIRATKFLMGREIMTSYTYMLPHCTVKLVNVGVIAMFVSMEMVVHVYAHKHADTRALNVNVKRSRLHNHSKWENDGVQYLQEAVYSSFCIDGAQATHHSKSCKRRS